MHKTFPSLSLSLYLSLLLVCVSSHTLSYCLLCVRSFAYLCECVGVGVGVYIFAHSPPLSLPLSLETIYMSCCKQFKVVTYSNSKKSCVVSICNQYRLPRWLTLVHNLHY
jgi:hypothetical protein